MSELKQIKFSKIDRHHYIIPVLEKQIRFKEVKLRKSFQLVILMGSVISFFSLRFSYELSKICTYQEQEDDYYQRTFGSIFFILFSCLSGWFIDVLSIKSTWHFFLASNVIGQIIMMIAAIYDSQQIFLIGKIIFYSLLPVCIINFTCILYENSGDFRTRLNNAILLEVLGEFTCVIIVLVLNALLKEWDLDQQSEKQIKFSILISGLIICQLFNFVSYLILDVTYNKLHEIRSKSVSYGKYLIYQGFGISLRKVGKYFISEDIFYLCAIATACGFQSRFINSIEIPNSVFKNILLMSVFLICSIVGYIIMKRINNSQQLVQVCYKATSICIYLLALVSIIQTTLFFAFNQTSISSSIGQVDSTIITLFQGCIFIVLYSLIHQILLFLLHQRCAIRGFSLSITFVFYSSFYFISNLIGSNDRLFLIFQLSHIILVSLFNYRYQLKRKYNEIDIKVSIKYQISSIR